MHLHHKCQSYDVWFLRYGVHRTEFFVILDHFLPFYSPNNPKKSKFLKNKKIAWRYYHFTDVSYKCQSHDAWFLRYGAWWTEFFIILGNFLHFYLPNNPKNQNFEKNENTTWRYYQFPHVYHKWKSYDVWFLRYGVCDGQNFLSFSTVFCPFTPLTTWKIKILKIWKKMPKYIINLHMCTINDNYNDV